jgi:hypothetical protein
MQCESSCTCCPALDRHMQCTWRPCMPLLRSLLAAQLVYFALHLPLAHSQSVQLFPACSQHNPADALSARLICSTQSCVLAALPATCSLVKTCTARHLSGVLPVDCTANRLQQFTRVYGPTAATRTLSQNYRSKEPIVEVAEIVRRHGRCALPTWERSLCVL